MAKVPLVLGLTVLGILFVVRNSISSIITLPQAHAPLPSAPGRRLVAARGQEGGLALLQQLSQRDERIRALQAEAARLAGSLGLKAQPVASAQVRTASDAVSATTASVSNSIQSRMVTMATSKPGEIKPSFSLLSPEDVLRRIPRNELAYISLANNAYAELAINWALVLLPMLAQAGKADHAILAALDDESERTFTKRGLPTMRSGLGGLNSGGRKNYDFRWEMGAFRAYGVSKAEMIIWLLREGRDVCFSDVDTAWIAPPHAILDGRCL